MTSLQMRRTALLRTTSNQQCAPQYLSSDSSLSFSSSSINSPEFQPSGSVINDSSSPVPESSVFSDLKMLENVLLARLPTLSHREYALILDFFQSVPYAEHYLPLRKFTQIILLHNMNYVLYYLISRIIAASLATSAGNLVLEGGFPDVFLSEAKEYLSIEDPLVISPSLLYQDWELHCLNSAQLLQVYCTSLLPLN